MQFVYDDSVALRPFTGIAAEASTPTFPIAVREISAGDDLGYCCAVNISASERHNPLSLEQLREAHEMLGLALKEVERRKKARDEEVPF